MSKIKAQLLEQLIELERTLMREEVRADAARLDELLDDDFIEVSTDGRRMNKESVLLRAPREQSKGRKPVFHNQDFTGRMLSDTVVQISYSAALRRIKGGQWHFSTRMSIWRLSDTDHWRLVYHQGSPSEPFPIKKTETTH
ncbi:DUF4440 domain-containing protein [Pseudoalteromonas sp. SSDWG2]|uniref:nuclear transport factor 2 family protein n=1 Tax=Pseudoalteromonas sp. SSDWG2 TaxID=3139391 RepID=UPI003BA8B21E